MGRVVRILIGVALAFGLVTLVRQAQSLLRPLPGWRIPGGDWRVVALACLWMLPQVIDDLLGRSFGRWTQVGCLCLLAIAVAVDRVADGVLWAHPLGLLALALMIFVFAAAGLSFLVGGIAGAPG